jgi:hypothetical protein
MKIKETTTTNSETSATIDLFEGLEVSPKLKKRISEEVGTFLIEQTLINVASSKSPISSQSSFPALSKTYKKKKLEEVGHSRPDLQFSGDTLDDLTFEETPEGIKIGVFGDRAPIADGHNNLSGKSKLPTRKFIPSKGENYKADITREVKRIVADNLASETKVSKETFANVTTKKDMLVVLKSIFGDLSKSELALAVFRNPDVLSALYDLDLVDLL